jgi:hypothetical protein
MPMLPILPKILLKTHKQMLVTHRSCSTEVNSEAGMRHPVTKEHAINFSNL